MKSIANLTARGGKNAINEWLCGAAAVVKTEMVLCVFDLKEEVKRDFRWKIVRFLMGIENKFESNCKSQFASCQKTVTDQVWNFKFPINWAINKFTFQHFPFIITKFFVLKTWNQNNFSTFKLVLGH